jgi:peptide/nickel transport system ATP-binding protein
MTARQLGLGFVDDDGTVRPVVDGVSLQLHPGRILGLAGESGCGKTTLALALTGFRVRGSRRISGSVSLGNIELLSTPERELSRIWGSRVAYLPQNAATALNPALRVGRQLHEPLKLHRGLTGAAARARAIALLERVGLPDPEAALDRYPHQFSGGQQQRIVLAMALSCEPAVLILDEPTTGLDVTTQARVNRLISSLVQETRTSTIYVSHDLSLLATIADRLAVMYAGQIVELGPADQLYCHPRHPYTSALVQAVPRTSSDTLPRGLPGLPPPQTVTTRCAFSYRCEFAAPECQAPVPLVTVEDGREVRCVRAGQIKPYETHRSSGSANGRQRTGDGPREAALEVRHLDCAFHSRGRSVHALVDVSLVARRGLTLGIAGESGSGKSTLLKCLAGLVRPSAGEMFLAGERLAAGLRPRTRQTQRRVQLVFQNPDSSLNPRHTARLLVERPLRLFRPDLDARARRDRIAELADMLRLSDRLLDRRPTDLSGGQRQRVALARALAGEPDVILCDEVTSALDVSVQASILELLAELCSAGSTTIVFVTHDLGVLRSLADELIVMRAGRIVESGPTARIYREPEADYTQALLDAVPMPPIEGSSGAPNRVDLS